VVIINYTKVRFEEVTGEFQNWPVTPYKVHVRSEFNAKECFAHLYIDGQKVDQKFLRAGSTVVFEGIPTAEGMKEVSVRVRGIMYLFPYFLNPTPPLFAVVQYIQHIDFILLASICVES
jgi:hypothetical protein